MNELFRLLFICLYLIVTDEEEGRIGGEREEREKETGMTCNKGHRLELTKQPCGVLFRLLSSIIIQKSSILTFKLHY